MVTFIKNILDEMLPSLDNYQCNIPQHNRAKLPDESKKVVGEVRNGVEYKTTYNEDARTSATETVKSASVARSPSEVVLDNYDIRALNECAPAWTESVAKVMMWHWQQGQSAKAIEDSHTGGNGTESGFSKRNAAKYVKAFYQAEKDRESDGKKTKKQAASPIVGGTVEW